MPAPPVEKYQLTGPQVDPGSGYWMYCSQLHVPTIDELLAITEDPGSRYFFPPPPDAETTAREFEELLQLARWRDDPCRLVSTADCPRVSEGDRRPCHRPRELPMAYGCRRPISKLLNLVPPSLGAVLVRRLPGEQIVRSGRGMARAIESETPGLHQRNALDYLIRSRSWSPPRQSLVWAALDVALASALQAAWYFKWINGWHICIDSIAKWGTSGPTSSISQSVTTTAGSHVVLVRAWDSTGAFGDQTLDVTASASGVAVNVSSPANGATVPLTFDVVASATTGNAGAVVAAGSCTSTSTRRSSRSGDRRRNAAGGRSPRLPRGSRAGRSRSAAARFHALRFIQRTEAQAPVVKPPSSLSTMPVT